MKKIGFILILVCSYNGVMAQTSQFRAKLNRTDEPVYLRMDQVSANIEGYDGDEIVIEAVPSVPKTPPEAASGLKQIAIPGRGKEDNIIKARMQEDTSGLRITIPAGNFSCLSIKVPKSTILFVIALMNLNDGLISVNNISSIDIEGILSNIKISNVTNFVVIGGGFHSGSRATGKVIISDVKWTSAPVIINGEPHHRTYIANSTNSDIELAVPQDAHANFILCSDYGQSFSNLNIASLYPRETDVKTFEKFYKPLTGLRSLLLNGGGVDVIMQSLYGNIYLKKQ